MSNIIDKMYDDLKAKGYLSKDRDTFNKFFFAPGETGYQNRKKLYDDLHNKGYLQSPSYEDFAQRIGLHSVRPSQTASRQQDVAQQANNRAAAQAAAAKSAPTQPEKGGWRPNAEQMAGYQKFTDGVLRTVKNGDDVMNRVNRRVARATRPNQQKVNLGFNNKHSLLGGGSQVQHEGKKFDAAKGDFVDQYSTEAGNVYDNAYEADAEQYNINRNKRDAETLDMVADIERQIREQEELLEKTRKASRDVKAPDNLWDALRYTMSHADGPRLDQEDIDEEAIKANITNLQNKRSLLLHGTSIGQKVGKSIGDQLAEVNKMIGDDIDNYYKRHPNGGPTLVSHDYHATGQYQINPYLNVAARSLEDAQEMFNEAGKSVGESGLSGFGAGVLRGFGSKLFDARTWDMGFTDIKGGLSLAEVLRKADEGKPLTAEQQKMLDAKATELACAAYFSGALGRGYKAGQVTAESIPFMLEFMLNPLSGTGRSAQAMLTRYALKRFGRKATMELGEDAAKKILYGDIRQLTKSVFDKGLSKGARGLAAKTLASKAGARIAGDITGAAGMTLTTGQGRVAADMLNRATGQVKFGVDTDGKVKYTGHDAPEESNLLKAYGKAFGSQFCENYSEFMGPYISYVGGMFANGLKKIGGKYLFDGLSSLRNRSAAAVMKLPFAPMVSDFIREATKSDWAKVIKGMQKRAHWDGTVEEYLEEVAGNMLNAILVGDNDFSTEEGRGVFNLSDNIDTFLGVSLMSGAMSVSSAAGYRTPAYRARKMVENADARGEKLLGGSLWGKFRSSFDAAQSEQDKQVILTSLLQNSSLTDEGRRAVLQYARGKQFQQAVADGTFREMEEDAEKGNEVERACRAEYAEGQNIDNVEEMRDAKTRYNVLLREALAVEPNAEIYSDPQFYEQSNPNATPEQKAAMRAYAEAKAQYEGVADRMKTDMADQQQKANEQVERFKNQTDGLITRVRLRGSDAEFYVTSGHISLNSDGTINDAATSSNLTIVDGEGNQRFISRGDVVDVLAQNTPEETLEQLNDIIMNEAKSKADLIDGKLSFRAGDTFTILNNEGQEQKVTIAQDPSTMAMSAVIEGEQAAVPLTEDSMAKLQQMSDAYQESRFGKYRQEQQDAVANAENEATQEEATTTSPTASQEEAGAPTEGRSYGYGESVSYVDGEGHTQEGVVHGKTPEGTYEVEFDNPPSGKEVVDEYTQEELDALVQPSSAEQTEEVVPEKVPEEEPVEPQGNDAANSVPPTTEELVEMARGGNELAQYQLDQQGIQWKEPAEQTKDNVAAQSPKNDVPRDKDGNIIYDQVPVATTIEDLYDGALDDEEIGNFVQSQIDAAKKAVDKITKKKPQISTNKSAYLEAKKKWEGELREAERKALYWNDVKAEVEKITTPADARGWKDELSGEAARRQYRENSGNDHEAKSESEVAAEFMSQGHVKITPESYRKETGFGLDEQRKMVGKISKEGKTIDQLSEELALFDEEYYNGRFFGGDSMVAKDALIAHLSSADARKGIAKVQSEAEAQFVENYEEQRERYYQERYHMSYEEYIEYSAQEMPELLRKYSNFDEQQFYDRYADEIEADLNRREQQSNNNGTEENDSTGEEQRHDRGNQVQSGQRTDDNSGSEGGKDSEGEVRTRDEGSDEQESSSEESSVEGQREQEIDSTPTLVNVIRTLYQKGKDYASKIFNMKFFDFATTPDFMKHLGMTGSKFTIRYGVIARHFGKDGSHDFTQSEWEQIPHAIEHPFAVTQLKNKEKGFRIYTALKTEKGEYVVVGVDVKNAGRDMEVNAIATMFGRRSNANLPENEEVIYKSKEITPEQEALLSRPNSDQYPAERESSDGKGKDISDSVQENGEKSSENEGEKPLSAQIDAASAEVNTEPTEAQKEAGNYKKGHVHVGSFDITIEQPQGSVRKGTDANGKQWESKMHNTYGYFRGTEGVDGDHIDVFLSNDIDGWNRQTVFVVDQYNPDGSFDEHKVMLGFNNAEEAKRDYLANYEKGWENSRRIDVSAVNLADFEKWIASSHRKTKPFSEYSSVKKEGSASSETKQSKSTAEEKPFNAVIEMLRKKFPDASMEALTAADRLLREQALPGERQKAIEAVAKALGLKVEWRDTMEKENGTFNPKTRTITIARDSEHALANTFGHEVTHAVRNLSEADYKNLKDAVRRLYSSEKEYNEAVQAYGDMYTGLDFDALEEELIADNIGFMIGGRNDMTQELASRMNHRVLWAIHDAMNKVRNALAKVLHIDSKKNGLLEAIDSARATIRETMANAQRIAKENSRNVDEALQTPNSDIVDNTGTTTAVTDSTDRVKASRRTFGPWTDNFGREHKGTRQQLIDYMNENGFDAKAVDDFVATMDYYYNYLGKVADFQNPDGSFRFRAFHEWNLKQPQYKRIGEKIENVVSTAIQNGEYAVNQELSTDCIKREAFTKLVNLLVARGADLSDMGPVQINTIKNMMRKHGVQVACDLCFVEGKRLGIVNWAQKVVDDWNRALEAVGLNPDELEAFNFGEYARDANGNLIDDAMFVPTEELGEGAASSQWKAINEVFNILTQADSKHYEDLTKRNKQNWMNHLKTLPEFKSWRKDHPGEKWDDKFLKELGLSKGKLKELKATRDAFLTYGVKDPKQIWRNSTAYAEAYRKYEREFLETNPDGVFEPTYAQRTALEKIRNRNLKNVYAKMQRLIAEHPEMRKRMQLSDLLGSKGLMQIRQENGDAYAQLWSLILARFGTGTPKPIQDSVPYSGEVYGIINGLISKAYEQGGARMFSFSDFDITKVFDIMQIYWDMAARGMKLQSYSKEAAYVIMFGKTGAKINISTLPKAVVSQELQDRFNASKPNSAARNAVQHEGMEYAGLTRDADGRISGLSWSNEHSAKPEFCQQIFLDPERNGNCGAITVGASVNHSIYAAAQDWIRMVIPFHLSGMPANARARTDVNWYYDNTPYQNTRVPIKGKYVSIFGTAAKKSKVKYADFDFYENVDSPSWDMRSVVRDYVRWCEENNYMPRFDWGINSEHYREFCEKEGWTPDQQIIDIMDNDMTDGVWNGYYKFITDFTAYKPVLDENGQAMHDEKGRLIEEPSGHTAVTNNFKLSDAERVALFGDVTGDATSFAEHSVLQNRTDSINNADANMQQMAREVENYLATVHQEKNGQASVADVEAAEAAMEGREEERKFFQTNDAELLMQAEGAKEESDSTKQSLRTQDSASEFAEKHGVAADDVRQYAEGMKSGNLQKADWALSEIRRTMRVANRGMKLSEFGKLFRPIQKELAERYGDIERLRQEHIDAEMRERNLMEAARKKAEEEERNRQARLEELSLLGDAEVDKRYMDALKRGDEATAREMLDEAARRKGYGDAESDYQGEGAWAAPSNPGYKSADERRADLENNTIFNVEDMALGYSSQPSDYFEHPKRYLQDTPHGLESTQSIQKAIEAVKRGDKDVKVKVYRAVPTSVKEGKLRNGDWVTPSKKYAEMHGNSRLEGKYRIIEDEVPVDELWWDGNDANEWGYDNGKGYKYKNVKNNRKSDDLVTRDDKGNVIPPSKRFNQRKADERYQKRTDGVKPSKAEVALRDALVEHMRLSGMDVISDEAGQRVLDMANGDDAKEQRIYHGSGADFDHVRFFRTANGEAYGFTVGGKIYIDPRIATSETPVHEYAHLWATALKSANAKEWQNVVGLMKGTKVWDEVKALYPELKSDDEIADEVLATYSGRRGAERLREEQRRIVKGNGGVFEKAEAISALERVKQALKRFWKGVADFLHIHYTSAEEVADRVMKDLLDGVDPRTFGDVEKGIRFQTSEELNNRFGGRWLDEQTNDDGRHTTQVKSTINSYKKFGDWVKRDSNGRDVDVLDASSGLGLGTAWMRDNGFKVDDVEPFPSDSREAPTFSSYDEINKKYDYIISNAVLNVIPDDWRANVLHQMADKLKDGGKLVINVRGAESISKQGKEGETRITLDSPSEILVLRPNGSIKAYQKGFTKSELKDWCEKELGEGYSVEIANNKNAGGSYDTAVVVTKNNESGTVGVASEAGHPSWSAQALPSSVAKLEKNQEYAKDLAKLSGTLSKKVMGAHEFLFSVAKAFGFEEGNFNKSFYKDLGSSVGIRISDHSANPDNIINRNDNSNVYGLVIKLSNHRFKSRKDANYLEYVYYPDKLTQERQQEIVGGLEKFLETGDYAQLPSPDRVNRSGVFDRKNDIDLESSDVKQSRRGTPNLYPDHIAQAIYEQSVNGFKFDLDEAWHDSLLSVKRLQEAISETRGVPIRDFENVYWHAVTLSSVNAAEMEQLMNLRIQPFIEAVQDICKKHDLTQEDIEVYLNCKHGLERNEAMARRDAEKQANEEFKDELRKAERAAAKDPLDQDAADALDDVKQRMNDREEELYFENREKDYSGLTDIFDPKDKVTGDRLDLTVAELEDEAKKYVKRFEAEVGVADVTKLWDNIHELNNYSLRKSYLSGLISKSQYDSVKQMYQWYVPLRGFNEEVAGDVYTYVTRGETMTQQLLKEAKGRTSRAGDILATMMNMANSAVNQGNRNLMKQKILNLALNAKSPLLSVSSTWYQTDANGFDVPIEPPINDQMTPSEQKDAIEQWEDTMEMLAKQGKVHRMSDNLRLNLRTQKWQADEHCIRVQRGGKEYCVWVNGNPRAAQALNDRLGNQVTKPYKATETILDKAEDLFTDGFIKIFRYMAQSVTSLNPEFVISNFQRDLASASLVSTGKYGVGYTKDFLVNVKRLGVLTGTMSHKKEYRNAAGIYTLYNKYKSRTLDNNNEMERYFAEFMANGGETGYTQSLSIKDYQSRIQSALGDKGFVKWSKNAGHAVADFVEMANRGVENTCRFAAYMTSRQHGKSVLQAIVDAKEASTNFNLHGAGGLGNAWLRKSIIFINPAVQSIVQYCQLTAKHPKAMLSMLGGTILLGAAMAFACARMVAPGGGDPDSNYWDLSDYVRHNYIVIPSGNGNWTRIALPPEIRAVYGLGVIAMEAAMGRMNHSSIPAAIGDQLMQFSPVAFLDPRNFFNRSDSDHSVGKTLIKAFTPTLASPIADAYIWDEDFMGRQITGKNDFNDDKPEFQRVSYDTLPQLVSFSRWLNNISGGNDYKKGWININPSAAGYVASQYIGGPLQFFTKIGKTVAMITYEDLRDMRNVPFLSRFMTSTDNDYGRNQVSNAEFKYWSAIADDVRTQIRGFEKEIESGDTKNLDDYKKLVSSKEYEMYQMIDYMDWLKDIRELNQKRKEETTQDAQKQVTLEIYEVRRKMAECLNKAEEMGVYLDMSQLNLELANAKTTEERAAIQAKINEKRKENLRKIGAIE